MRGLRTIFRLSLKDYAHEKLLSACVVMGLAAVLAPLLVLFGVKSGIINTMADRLIEDPRNQEISAVGSGRYNEAWFKDMAARKDVAFIIPQTRSIAANMTLLPANGRGRVVQADLAPTGPGDPVLVKWAKIPATDREIVLSEPAARKLGVKAGHEIIGRVGRKVSGRRQQAEVELKVIAVLPLGAFNREAAFVRLPLLIAAEDYRDGYSVPELGWSGRKKPDKEAIYPSFRLYAKSIYDVISLRNMLTDRGLEVYTRAEDIAIIQQLDKAFTAIFQLIAVVAVLGYFASMVSNVLANVNRKSRHLGVARLIGFSTGSIIWFPMAQSAATSILGSGAALILYFIAQLLINSLFSGFLRPGEYVCHLKLIHMAAAVGLTLLMAVIASAYAAYRVARIEPSEVIRDV